MTRVEIDEQEFGALIEAAYLLAEEDPFITKRILFVLSSYVASKRDGE